MNLTSNTAFSSIVFGTAACVVLAIAIIVVAGFLDRDGSLYRIVSKAVFPLSKNLVFKPSGVPAASIREKLDRAPAGWQWSRRELVTTSFGEEGLSMAPLREAVWWKNKRGPLLYTHFAGDFDARVVVQTRKRSAPASYPDEAYQFGGLVIRDPRGDAWMSREEYVFIAIGHRQTGLQIESKSTFNGYSDVIGTDWDSGDANLRIRRIGSGFELLAARDGSDEWRAIHKFERALPKTVQVGLFAYAYSNGEGVVDIKVLFRDFEIRPAGQG